MKPLAPSTPLEHIQSNYSGLINRASSFFLAWALVVNRDEAVSNLVTLISAINFGMVKIPKKYPKPLSAIMKNWFDLIIEGGGSLKIRLLSEKEFRTLEWTEKNDFISKCDILRFTVTEDPQDPGVLLVDIIK